MNAPVMDETWYAQPFRDRVDEVQRWLGSARLAIGHSFGGWLLLCAAAEIVERGDDIPPLLLLSSVLGTGHVSADGRVAVFSSPPRQSSMHRALGLTPGLDALFPPGRLEFVHAVDDEQCPVASAQALAGRYRVTLVRGGHTLDVEPARTVLSDVLERYRTPLASSEGR